MPIQDAFSANPQTALGRKQRSEMLMLSPDECAHLPEPIEGWAD